MDSNASFQNESFVDPTMEDLLAELSHQLEFVAPGDWTNQTESSATVLPNCDALPLETMENFLHYRDCVEAELSMIYLKKCAEAIERSQPMPITAM